MPYFPMVDALEQYLIRTALPILVERGNVTDAVGTGTIFRAGERYYVITANHVLTDELLENVASPLGRKDAKIMTWGNIARVNYNEKLGLDVTVIELKTPEMIAALADNYNILDLDQVGLPSPEAEHWLVGFPNALTQLTHDAVNQAPFILKTSMLAEAPDVPISAKKPDSRVDLFFELEREGVQNDGSTRAVPDLQGVSGASVWEVVDYSGSIWMPGKAVKVIGVQQSAKPGAYFRATRWELVVPLIYNLDHNP